MHPIATLSRRAGTLALGALLAAGCGGSTPPPPRHAPPRAPDVGADGLVAALEVDPARLEPVDPPVAPEPDVALPPGAAAVAVLSWNVPWRLEACVERSATPPPRCRSVESGAAPQRRRLLVPLPPANHAESVRLLLHAEAPEQERDPGVAPRLLLQVRHQGRWRAWRGSLPVEASPVALLEMRLVGPPVNARGVRPVGTGRLDAFQPGG